MTDSQMVEKVAREVIGWTQFSRWNKNGVIHQQTGERFDPLTDANDTQLVKDKLLGMGFKIMIAIWPSGGVLVSIYPFDSYGQTIEAEASDEARAICEAAIKAVENGEEK